MKAISVFLMRGIFWSCKYRKQDRATTLWAVESLFSGKAVLRLPFWNVIILKFQILDRRPVLPSPISEKGSDPYWIQKWKGFADLPSYDIVSFTFTQFGGLSREPGSKLHQPEGESASKYTQSLKVQLIVTATSVCLLTYLQVYLYC